MTKKDFILKGRASGVSDEDILDYINKNADKFSEAHSSSLPDYLKAPDTSESNKMDMVNATRPDTYPKADQPQTLAEAVYDYPKGASDTYKTLSAPFRVQSAFSLPALADRVLNKNKEPFLESIARGGKREGENPVLGFIEDVKRNPIQMAASIAPTPFGKAGIVKQGLGALATGVAAGGLTEAENVAEGKDFNWKNPALQGIINVLFHGGAKAFTGAGKVVKEGVPDIKAAAKAKIAPETTGKGVYLSPASVGGKKAIPQQEIERFANANATTKEIPMKLAEQNRKAMEANIGGERQAYGATTEPMNPDLRASGTKLENTINDISSTTKETTIQDKANLLNTEIEGGKTLKQFDIPSDPITKANMISQSVKDDIVQNFDVHGVNMYAKVTKPMTNYLDDVVKEAQGIKNLNDLNNMRSHVYTEAVSGKWPDTKDAAALMSIGDVLDQKLKAAIGIALGPEKGPIAQEMLEATNARAKEAVGIVSGIRSATSMGAVKTNPDEYWSGIENIKPETIKSVMTSLDGTYKELAAQIRAGFVDNIIAKSLNKGMFSPDKFAAAWGNYAKNDQWVRTILDDKTVNAFNELADNARAVSPYLPQNINPSGTTLTQETIKAMDRSIHPSKWPDMVANFFMKSKIKDYYKTGNIDPMLTSWRMVRGIGYLGQGIGTGLELAQPAARTAVSDATSYNRKRKDLGTEALTK